MATIQEDVVVDAPLDMVYGQWTQFEEFPRFMKNVKEVRQIDDKRLFWRAEIGGQEHSWEAQIIRQVPNQVVSWASTEGFPSAGEVTFEPEGSGEKTRMHVEMDYEPEGVKDFLLKLKGNDTGRLKDGLEKMLSKNGVRYELRTSSQDDLMYSVRLPLTKRTDRLTNAILELGELQDLSVEWSDKKPSKEAA